MKFTRSYLAGGLASVVLAGAASAQTTATSVAQPSSPAPIVVSAPETASRSTAATTPGTVVVRVQSPATAGALDTTGYTQIVYTPQLPSAADLTKAAAEQGLTVERIVQTSMQVIAFYRSANGQATTVAYQSLPPSGPPASSAPAGVTSAAPPVVYETAPRVAYRDYDPDYYYYPNYWYPPISFGVGFGYRSFHGGFRHR